MIRYVLLVLILLGLAVDASACNRCGLFGRKCRFASHHVAHVPYVAPATTTNFVFNNTFPAPFLLAGQGSSVYGVQQASAAYLDRPEFFMDRAVRLEELRTVNAERGYQQFQESGRLAMSLNSAENLRANNTMLALAAMEKNTGAYQQTLAVRIDSGGNVSYSQPQAVTQAGPLALTQSQSCGACHDGRGTKGAPKHIILDGSVEVDDLTLTASFAEITKGTMPPGSKLTDPQKDVVKASLARLLARPRGVLEPLPPPAPENPLPDNDMPPPPPVAQPPRGNLD